MAHLSDTLHYCVVGDAYDVDGALLEFGDLGSPDKWGRHAGDDCPGNM